MSIIDWIIGLFKHESAPAKVEPTPVVVAPVPTPVPQPSQPVPAPTPVVTSDVGPGAIGIDCFHGDGGFDVADLKAKNIKFVILKATQGAPGDFVDPEFAKRWKALKAAGIVRGAYHFMEASQDGAKQARFFLDTVKAAGGFEAGDLLPCLDWESDRYRTTYPVVSFATQLKNAQDFMDVVEKEVGVKSIYYTGRHRLVENKHPSSWTQYPLWLCDYVGDMTVVAPYTNAAIWQKSDQAPRDAGTKLHGDFNILQCKLSSLLIGGKASPVATVPDAPKTVDPKKITRDQLVDAMLARTKKYIDLPVRETNGANRSTIIDGWNKRTGAGNGAPYCASSTWCLWDDTCKELGLKNPMHATASSQAFVTSVPSKYVRQHAELGKRGDAGVLTVASDSGHGHMTTLREDQVKQPYFNTYEFNTNSAGSRDGDGGYAKTRSTIDKSSENAGKLFRAFSDIPQWIIDFNS